MKKKAVVDHGICVACGVCVKLCPRDTIFVNKGMYADVDYSKCIGCGICKNVCPAGAIRIEVMDQ